MNLLGRISVKEQKPRVNLEGYRETKKETRRDGRESKRSVLFGGPGSGPQCHPQLRSYVR